MSSTELSICSSRDGIPYKTAKEMVNQQKRFAIYALACTPFCLFAD